MVLQLLILNNISYSWLIFPDTLNSSYTWTFKMFFFFEQLFVLLRMNRLLVTELNAVQEILKMSSWSVLFSHYGQVLLTSIKAFWLCNKSKDKCFPRENKEIKLMGKTSKTQPPPPHMIPLWYGWLTQQKLTTAALSVVTCPGYLEPELWGVKDITLCHHITH